MIFLKPLFRFISLLLLIAAPIAQAQGNDEVFNPSGLPIPRFVSLKSNEVNIRVGPGTQYPIEWVYQRKHLPVEIIEEFGHWRKIRDYEGTEGWAHKNLLSGTRTAFILSERRGLHAAPDRTSPLRMQADPLVIGRIEECNTRWCQLSILEREGWISRDFIYGLYPGERFETDD